MLSKQSLILAFVVVGDVACIHSQINGMAGLTVSYVVLIDCGAVIVR